MNTRDWTKEEAEVISMEEYLAKRKKIREDERKHKKKGSDDREESLMPFEFYIGIIACMVVRRRRLGCVVRDVPVEAVCRIIRWNIMLCESEHKHVTIEQYRQHDRTCDRCPEKINGMRTSDQGKY